MAEDTLWSIAFQICLGVGYLHSQKVIHRDLKCLNILLTGDNVVKIGDLGVSKIFSQAEHQLQQAQMTQQQIGNSKQGRVGTPLYLSPEVVKQQPYDYKIDSWALGCCLYHLACLEPPFQAENVVALGNKIVTEEPKLISLSYGENLRKFIQELLEKKPSERPYINQILRNCTQYFADSVIRTYRETVLQHFKTQLHSAEELDFIYQVLITANQFHNVPPSITSPLGGTFSTLFTTGQNFWNGKQGILGEINGNLDQYAVTSNRFLQLFPDNNNNDKTSGRSLKRNAYPQQIQSSESKAMDQINSDRPKTSVVRNVDPYNGSKCNKAATDSKFRRHIHQLSKEHIQVKETPSMQDSSPDVVQELLADSTGAKYNQEVSIHRSNEDSTFLPSRSEITGLIKAGFPGGSNNKVHRIPNEEYQSMSTAPVVNSRYSNQVPPPRTTLANQVSNIDCMSLQELQSINGGTSNMNTERKNVIAASQQFMRPKSKYAESRGPQCLPGVSKLREGQIDSSIVSQVTNFAKVHTSKDFHQENNDAHYVANKKNLTANNFFNSQNEQGSTAFTQNSFFRNKETDNLPKEHNQFTGRGRSVKQTVTKEGDKQIMIAGIGASPLIINNLNGGCMLKGQQAGKIISDQFENDTNYKPGLILSSNHLQKHTQMLQTPQANVFHSAAKGIPKTSNRELSSIESKEIILPAVTGLQQYNNAKQLIVQQLFAKNQASISNPNKLVIFKPRGLSNNNRNCTREGSTTGPSQVTTQLSQAALALQSITNSRPQMNASSHAGFEFKLSARYSEPGQMAGSLTAANGRRNAEGQKTQPLTGPISKQFQKTQSSVQSNFSSIPDSGVSGNPNFIHTSNQFTGQVIDARPKSRPQKTTPSGNVMPRRLTINDLAK